MAGFYAATMAGFAPPLTPLGQLLPHVAIDEPYLLLAADGTTQRRLIGASLFACVRDRHPEPDEV
jgi:hypothetical protein